MGVLEGKVAVVTGAGRGLGRNHALLLAQEGAKVVVNDLGAELDGTGKSSDPADNVVKEIKDAGGEAVANYESVADFQGAKRIIDCAVDNFGKLELFQPWHIAKSIDIGRRWTVTEIGERIHELGDFPTP